MEERGCGDPGPEPGGWRAASAPLEGDPWALGQAPRPLAAAGWEEAPLLPGMHVVSQGSPAPSRPPPLSIGELSAC